MCMDVLSVTLLCLGSPLNTTRTFYNQRRTQVSYMQEKKNLSPSDTECDSALHTLKLISMLFVLILQNAHDVIILYLTKQT